MIIIVYVMYMKKTYPVSVTRALLKIGSDIRDARLRRRLQMQTVADRASISRVTLTKVEKGDPGVAFGSYVGVLHALGLLNRLSDIADVIHDQVGLALEEEHLPKRIRYPGKTEYGHER